MAQSPFFNTEVDTVISGETGVDQPTVALGHVDAPWSVDEADSNPVVARFLAIADAIVTVIYEKLDGALANFIVVCEACGRQERAHIRTWYDEVGRAAGGGRVRR